MARSTLSDLAPGYDNNNHYKLAGTSVDPDGNLLTDPQNTYAWDVYGDMTLVENLANTITPTYDAFGRLVEVNNGTQFIYSPAGGPFLAQVSSQAVLAAAVRLPGGSYAFYSSSSTPSYYAHADWLGTNRLLSDTNRGTTPTMAYAPFGEVMRAATQDLCCSLLVDMQ